MPDLVVHLAAAAPLRRLWRDRTMAWFVLAGAALPDLAFKAVAVALTGKAGFALVSHTPAGVLALCYLASFLVDARLRTRAFAAMVVGAATHLLLDATKDYLGAGVIPWAYPFSVRPYEWSLFVPEMELWLAPVAVGAALLMEWALRGED